MGKFLGLFIVTIILVIGVGFGFAAITKGYDTTDCNRLAARTTQIELSNGHVRDMIEYNTFHSPTTVVEEWGKCHPQAIIVDVEVMGRIGFDWAIEYIPLQRIK